MSTEEIKHDVSRPKSDGVRQETSVKPSAEAVRLVDAVVNQTLKVAMAKRDKDAAHVVHSAHYKARLEQAEQWAKDDVQALLTHLATLSARIAELEGELKVEREAMVNACNRNAALTEKLDAYVAAANFYEGLARSSMGCDSCGNHIYNEFHGLMGKDIQAKIQRIGKEG